MADTANCIICYEPVVSGWIGHVLKDGKKISAGWCGKHHMDSPEALLLKQPIPKGNFGQWNEKMGIYRRTPKKENQNNKKTLNIMPEDRKEFLKTEITKLKSQVNQYQSELNALSLISKTENAKSFIGKAYRFIDEGDTIHCFFIFDIDTRAVSEPLFLCLELNFIKSETEWYANISVECHRFDEIKNIDEDEVLTEIHPKEFMEFYDAAQDKMKSFIKIIEP